jgi:1D-myo-inositol-tetrakisphosphate 5-kinase/inositol-polyphosphate multikinase
MPQWYGTLSSSEQQESLAAVAAQHPGTIVIPASNTRSATDTPTTSEPVSQTPAFPQEVSWTPSYGHKLDTGISIVLENVAEGFKRPNVLDVKLGARLWADDAPPAKRAKLDAVSKETTSSTVGFRIAGMKVWAGHNDSTSDANDAEFTDPYRTKYEGAESPKGQVVEKNGYKRYDKWYGRSFTAENVKEGFETFLAGAKAGKVDRSKLIAARLVDELRAVRYVLESEESRMYSSSVLIIYEGDPDALEEALEEEKRRKELSKDISDHSPETVIEVQGNGIDIASLAPDLGSLQPLEVKVGDETHVQGALNIELDPQAFEGDGEEEEDDDDGDDDEEPIKVHELRLIDFAHASWTPGQGPDENALMGVRRLLKIMEELSEDTQGDGPQLEVSETPVAGE